ncbi:winged helix-turn-helix domain-containing protein [Acrocarpospora catenulata]|uniref:winged helix-turn-helix domain-containing protein n=1 Tax=Acrocarpospora catenulata TaxID=2836182 RepID=UPI001BDAA872|nr:winged helix-turn-helix domain-containing protein [Acrocarpospora catenulata]
MYQQIANMFRAQIKSRVLKDGDMLPSEKEIAKRYGVGLKTANRAVRVLRNESLAYMAQGYGTFVGQRSSRLSPVPCRRKSIYRTIADEIISDIRGGTFLPLDQLPSEDRFARCYQVSRGTVRQAMALLRDLSWVFTVPCKGTFVEHEDNWPGATG